MKLFFRPCFQIWVFNQTENRKVSAKGFTVLRWKKKINYAADALHCACTEFTVYSVNSDSDMFARKHTGSLKICKTSNYKQISYSVNRSLYSVRIRPHVSAKSDEPSSGLITTMKNGNGLQLYFRCVLAYSILCTILNSTMFRSTTFSWTSAFRN